jgi:hypothetical protein
MLVICTIVLGTPAKATTTGPVLNPANGHLYYTFDDVLTWPGAEALAVTLGGHLVTINDAAENAWILSTLTTTGQTYWIGANDAATEGSFLWVSGEPFSYTNWAVTEPDDDGGLAGDFAYLDATTGAWFDTNGAVSGFVTGGVAEVVPEPSSLVLLAFGLIALQQWTKRRDR